MIGFLLHGRRGGARGTRVDALIVGVIVAAFGGMLKFLLTHGWGDDETASGAAAHPLLTVVIGASVIVAGVVLLILRWRAKQEGP